jgi:hypothetical protein
MRQVRIPGLLLPFSGQPSTHTNAKEKARIVSGHKPYRFGLSGAATDNSAGQQRTLMIALLFSCFIDECFLVLYLKIGAILYHTIIK